MRKLTGRWAGQKLSMEESVNECAEAVTSVIITAADVIVPVGAGGRRWSVVPWWTDECSKVVQERDIAPRALKNGLTETEYQRKKAMARRTINKKKRKKLGDV